MKRTISVMVGKGSQRHNSRLFTADNVNADRTELNTEYCDKNIKDVYHELFDEALEKYNAKQKRSDRKIDDYYEKIRTGKQEKLFHEIILQVGHKDNMAAESENGLLAKDILDEYMKGFQERNLNLKVFSAHLHMDEATPHIHIDFIPFMENSKRGLEKRVSLKQALASQGFNGSGRSNTEWNQWVQSEKEVLAGVMEKHGVEWEQLGTHEKHLSVLDYKKQERTEEVKALENKKNTLEKQIESLGEVIANMEVDVEHLVYDIDKTLPEAATLESAKAYREKKIKPFMSKVIGTLKAVYLKLTEVKDDYYRLQKNYSGLVIDHNALEKKYKKVFEENVKLRQSESILKKLEKKLGREEIEKIIKGSKKKDLDR